MARKKNGVVPKGTAYPQIREYDWFLGSKLVHEVMSPYQLIRVFKHGNDCWMSLNGDMQFHTKECDLSHYFMCDLILDYFKKGRPTATGGSPSILVIGGGDGMPGKRLQKHGVNFTQVELDPELIRTTKTVPEMRKACDDSFNSKYINLICGDGIGYVINSRRKWDIIIDDCDTGSTNQPGATDSNFDKYYETYQQALIKKLSPYGILGLTEELVIDKDNESNTIKNRCLDMLRIFHKGPMPPRRTWAKTMEENVDEWKNLAPYGKHFGSDLPYIGPEHYIYLSKKPL